MSDEQLEERISAAAQVTSGSLNYYVAEHTRRDQERQARTLTRLTWVATIAAVLSLVAAVLQVIAAFIALR
jgi:Mg2+ and Co2+ transporter CorA